ncbi:DUF3182 family protein [Variovorax sp. RT4R15]|uniref:DUF3182 family protein n=1 Tax=Variovorax sp. RT4R15 TaxID=3443737 RepID=UPI003F46A93B
MPALAPLPARAADVVALTASHRVYDSDQEHATRAEAARRLAALKGVAFRGEYLHGHPYGAPLYLVPSDTLTAEVAHGLGVHSASDLFGGVVPWGFVGTKVITHPLVHAAAVAPIGWTPAFPERVAEAVLRGFSVFSHDDARKAGALLLADVPVRVKPACATGGRGQTVVKDAAALDRCLAEMSSAELAEHGLVLEENLCEPVVTLSVGQVTVGDLCASYHGVQRTTRSNHGNIVYGGSDLTLVRGDFDALLQQPDLTPRVRLGIEQARRYHEAALDCFPGFFASRINYDVAQGRSSTGAERSGVLEQSWRLGGATGAEIAGLECFRDRPDCQRVEASCFEVYGTQDAPPDATVYFRGVDKQTGQLVKYAVVR